MYYEITADGEGQGKFDRRDKDQFIKDFRNDYHEIAVAYYNSEHLNVGAEIYIDGKLIYQYRE